MNFWCRIGLHDWVYGKPFSFRTNWLDGTKVVETETSVVQNRTCSRCSRVKRVKVGP